MDFGQAFGDAGALLTLLGLLTVLPLMLVMAQNITNPEFDMMAAFEVAIYGIVQAAAPALGVTFILAVILWFVANGN